MSYINYLHNYSPNGYSTQSSYSVILFVSYCIQITLSTSKKGEPVYIAMVIMTGKILNQCFVS